MLSGLARRPAAARNVLVGRPAAARCWTGRSRSACSEPPVSELRCPRSAAASPSGLSECGDSDLRVFSAATQEDGSELLSSGWQILSSATQEDCRSSATPQDCRSSATPDLACECTHSLAQRFWFEQSAAVLGSQTAHHGGSVGTCITVAILAQCDMRERKISFQFSISLYTCHGFHRSYA